MFGGEFTHQHIEVLLHDVDPGQHLEHELARIGRLQFRGGSVLRGHHVCAAIPGRCGPPSQPLAAPLMSAAEIDASRCPL